MKMSIKKRFTIAFIFAVLMAVFTFSASLYTFEVLIGRLTDYAYSLSDLNAFRYEFKEYNTALLDYLDTGSRDSLDAYNDSKDTLFTLNRNIRKKYAQSEDVVASSLGESIYSTFQKYSQQTDELILYTERSEAIDVYNEKYYKTASYIENYIEKMTDYQYTISKESLAITESRVNIFKPLQIGAFAILLLVLILLGRLVTRDIVNPLIKLTRQSKQIANYNFDIYIDHFDTNDEVAELFDNFRSMKESLKNTFNSNQQNIETANALLEKHGIMVDDSLFLSANVDRLTGIMNKNAFIKLAGADIIKKSINMYASVFTINIQNYNLINDALMEGADELLKKIASELTKIMEPYGYVARLDTSTFACFSSVLNNGQIITELCEIMSSALNTRFNYGKTSCLVNARIGAFATSSSMTKINDMIDLSLEQMKSSKTDRNFSVFIK